MRSISLFARRPLAGHVKSRLSPALPPRAAARLYSGILGDALAAVAGCSADERGVHWADERGEAPPGFVHRAQRGADLGERLAAALGELLRSPGDAALVVGSDAPALGALELAAALEALDAHDAVLGPARDGGYWCVGLRQPAPELFREIPWSTSRVLERTQERARAAGLRVATVATLDDIDTPSDVARLVGRVAAGEPVAGAHTLAALRELGLAAVC